MSKILIGTIYNCTENTYSKNAQKNITKCGWFDRKNEKVWKNVTKLLR